MANKRVGRPKGGQNQPTITIMSPDELIRKRHPDALIGLIRARQSAEWTYAQAAEVLGVTASQYGKLEKGQCRMLLRDAKRLADTFGVKVDDLL